MRESRSRRDEGTRPNSVGLDERQLDSLLNEVDQANRRDTKVKRRVFTRWPFRQSSMSLRVTHPGGTVITLKVACRNISSGGLSVLHSSFIYPGSACIAFLPHPKRGEVAAPGQTVRCVHMHRMVHEIGLRFADPIQVREYVPDTDSFVLEHVEEESLSGAVLYVPKSPLDQGLIRHYLRGTRVRLRTTMVAKEAAAFVREGCDVVIIDQAALSSDLGPFLDELRSGQGGVPVVAVAVEPGARPAMEVAGLKVNVLLTKPLTQETVLRALGEVLLIRPGRSARGVGKDARASEAMRREFTRALAGQAGTIERCVQEGDAMGCYVQCMHIRGAAPAAGLDAVGKLAGLAADSLGKTLRVSDAKTALVALIAACRRAASAGHGSPGSSPVS